MWSAPPPISFSSRMIPRWAATLWWQSGPGRTDELGELAVSFRRIVSRLHTYMDYIQEISEVLDEMSHRNLVFDLNQDYVGQFHQLKESMDNIQASLSSALFSILEASEEVDNSSGQMASGAQALAQGATEQASTVQELAASVQELWCMTRTMQLSIILTAPCC